jgi:hypothetical protein
LVFSWNKDESVGIIGSEGGFWEGRQRQRTLIAEELFWWLTGRKYELGRW